MPVFQRLWAAAAALSWALSGCGPGLGPAREAFLDGRFPEAAAELRAVEPRVLAVGGRTFFRYARLRGLVELGVGNARVAAAWLTIARRADARDPRLFDTRERGELESAWRAMGHMPGDGS
jgi:hypothetical protein